ncbi:MAG: VOC family protein [Acidimicrobiia bacterium]|nr:VOC family protein [Acidimicrobiia bacterium]
MSINRIGQIHITVQDIEGAVAFYRDVVGLTHLFDVPAQQMSFFQLGETRLYLGRSSSPEFQSNPILYLEVDDIDAEHGRLRKLGVEFMSEPSIAHRDENGELWLSFFRTPEGLPTALMETKATAG